MQPIIAGKVDTVLIDIGDNLKVELTRNTGSKIREQLRFINVIEYFDSSIIEDRDEVR